MILAKSGYWPPSSTAIFFPVLQGGPLMHIIAAKAVALKEALAPEFARVPAGRIVKKRDPAGPGAHDRGRFSSGQRRYGQRI